MRVEQMRLLPFEKACAGWLEMRKVMVAQDALAPTTLRQNTLQCATLSRWFGSQGKNPKKLPAITADDVKDFRDDRQKEVYRKSKNGKEILVGPASVNQEVKILKQLRAYIGMPFAKGEFRALKRAKSKVGQALSDEQRAHLLETAKLMAREDPVRWETIGIVTQLAVNIGAGPKEIASIQLVDIHLDEEIPWLHIKGTKTEGRDRIVALNVEAQEALILALDRAKRCGAVNPDHFLFPYLIRKGRRYDPTRPQTCFRKAWWTLRQAAGLPTFRQYDIRHDFITRQLSDGTPDQVVEEQVGHVTAAQKKAYSHQRLEAKQKAVDRMLGRKMKKYEKKPAQSVATDPELAQQMASMFKGFLQSMFAEMQKPK